jgi:hypothetical protein
VVSGICFDDANLHRTDFSGALLVNASFDHADLRNTNFESADLRNAKITYLRTPEHVFEDDPVQQRDQRDLLSGHRNYNLDPPDFRCADLRNSTFKGYMLFMLVPNEFPQSISLAPSFDGANLEGADLSDIRILIRTHPNDERSPFASDSSHVWTIGNIYERRIEIKPTTTLTSDANDFQKTWPSFQVDLRGQIGPKVNCHNHFWNG